MRWQLEPTSRGVSQSPMKPAGSNPGQFFVLTSPVLIRSIIRAWILVPVFRLVAETCMDSHVRF